MVNREFTLEIPLSFLQCVFQVDEIFNVPGTGPVLGGTLERCEILLADLNVLMCVFFLKFYFNLNMFRAKRSSQDLNNSGKA